MIFWGKEFCRWFLVRSRLFFVRCSSLICSFMFFRFGRFLVLGVLVRLLEVFVFASFVTEVGFIGLGVRMFVVFRKGG